MKEKIYTIPVNEAFDSDCECPFCILEKKLENDAVEYALGAAMMEPDNRLESNNKGFCGRHFKMLYDYPNRLGLALVLDTHLEEIRKRLSKYEKNIPKSGGLFKKGQSAGEEISGVLEKISSGCVICERIEHTMVRYIDVSVELWNDETEFKKKFENSKGVCLKHFDMLVLSAEKKLKAQRANEFISFLCKKQCNELKRIQEDIHKFTLKFDYRNADMPWGTAKDAPIRCVEKINGYIDHTEDENEL